MKKLKLRTYIEKLKQQGIVKNLHINDLCLETLIDSVSYDTRTLHGNSIFICKGANFKDEYARQAVESGAVCCIAQKKIEGIENFVGVNDIRKAIVACAQLYFDNAPKKLKTVGVTGTKGKGCVAFFLREILNRYLKAQAKNECAFLTSVNTYDGVQDVESHLTTPETIELYQCFDNAYNSDIEYLIMEVSSLAIKFGRTIGVPYEVACFTNFGVDHVSDIEHPNLEDYFASKLRIFDSAKNACVNLDSDRANEIYAYAQSRCNVLTFGENNKADISASNVVPHGNSIDFHLKTPNFQQDVCLGVPGLFNVSNALAATSIACFLEIPEKYIVEGLAHASVPGRMKVYTSEDDNLLIFVDYAHNEMSFNAIFNSLKKEYPKAAFAAIFGAPGNKANERREQMPRVASKFCDYIVITEDDPAKEGFEKITNEIVANISIDNFDIIEHREDALKHAVFN